MDDKAHTTPDLKSILATLAQFAPAAAPQTPDDLAATTPSRTQTPPERLQTRPTDFRVRAQDQSTTASPKPIDPASITTWQDGLRCVTKIAVQNAGFASALRRMMQEQRAHEMRWYSERQNLKQVQATRSTSAARAQSILQSLGDGLTFPIPESGPEVDKDEELAQFDRKIYVAQQAMETAMTAELKALGVPFFGTDAHLIAMDGNGTAPAKLPGDHPKWSPVITVSQLMNLRRKMISHLEDLYRD